MGSHSGCYSKHTGCRVVSDLDMAAIMIALGGCAGVALGLVASRYVEKLFYQVKSTDGDMLVVPACAFLLTALVATLPAVIRALRTDPTEILRTE
jgi:ABC-type lipoprotein release transport system permease subunit